MDVKWLGMGVHKSRNDKIPNFEVERNCFLFFT